MAFLNFAKKKGKIPDTTDLDIPPEPPKIMEEDISTNEPIDEELMPLRKTKPKKEKLPEIPPLPKMEELEPLPEEGLAAKELKELELPPPPVKKKRGFFFRKPKKAVEIPSIEEELPPLPPLPKGEEEIPPMPSSPREEKKLPPLPEKEIPPMPSLPEIEEELPAIPPLPKEEKEFPEIPPIPETKEKVPELPPLPEKVPTLPELERGIHFTPPKPPPPERPVQEPLKPEEPLHEEVKPRKRFIVLDDFKQIQSNITNTKSTLKDIYSYLSELEEVKGIDKKYSELNNNLQDIQKKLVFVDKTLFKEV
jgi:hypothetical protein